MTAPGRYAAAPIRKSTQVAILSLYTGLTVVTFAQEHVSRGRNLPADSNTRTRDQSRFDGFVVEDLNGRVPAFLLEADAFFVIKSGAVS